MEEYIKFLSKERLQKYKLSEADTTEDIIERYAYNIKLSEALYPALSLFEVTLRNKIDIALDKIVDENWLVEEFLKKQDKKILLEKENKMYEEAFKKCLLNKVRKHNRNNETQIKINNEYRKITNQEVEKALLKLNEKITKGELLPELNFGFWVNLCTKQYNPNIWMKKGVFEETFPYFDEFVKKSNPNRIVYIGKKLNHILALRNRIFHHEPIIFNNYIKNNYNDIEELMIFMSNKGSDLLNKISRFNKVIK